MARPRAGHGVLAIRLRPGSRAADAAERRADRRRFATAGRQSDGSALVLFAEEPRPDRRHRRAPSTQGRARRLARSSAHDQRSGDRRSDRHCQPSSECHPPGDRQRGDPAQRSQRRRAVRSARSRARGGRATREHGRAVARVDQEPATGRARGLHRRAHAAVLGRHSRRAGGRLSRDARRATGARVSRQADRHRRSRLALRRPHARGRGRVDQQRSDVPAALPATRAGLS
jgi:hypothetical protein